MKKDKNMFLRLLSLITYKKKKEPKRFVLPEFDKIQGKKGTNLKDNTYGEGTNKSLYGEKGSKSIKKPFPLFKKDSGNTVKEANNSVISTDIQANTDYIKGKFNAPDNKDIIIREFTIAKKYKAFIAYLDGMVDRVTINNFVLAALLENDDKFSDMDDGCQLRFILKNILQTNQAKEVTIPEDIIYEILSGNTVLYVDGCDYYITAETKGYEKRPVDKPQIEGIIIGPQEAFNETLRTNITLIRKIIKNSNLITEFLKVGQRNQNLCAVMYIKGLTNPAIIDEVKRRIKGVKADFISGDALLSQFIDENPYSLFPTYLNTERPDRAASLLMEGKVAILVEGSPFSIIVPITSQSLIHSPEDSFLRWQFGSFIRMVRLVAVFFATALPGLYVAMTTFHQEMIPTDLLIAIAKAKENVPFPTILEVLLMEISFELIREAGVRIPGVIGNTLGIIGALILGQAAVQANIVSPILIIVVAITGLGNFAIPNFNIAFSVRIIRFVFILAGALLGFYGICIAFMIVLGLLVNLKSYGVNFYSPVSPKTRGSFDYFLRGPLWKQELRPDYVNPLDVRRQPEISRQWAQEDSNYTNKGGETDD